MWRGKVIGGSGAINTMIYMQGHPRDYDEWETLGNKGWSYNDCLPYFKKLDKLMAPELPRHSTVLKNAFLKSGMLLGYPILNEQPHEQVHMFSSFLRLILIKLKIINTFDISEFRNLCH